VHVAAMAGRRSPPHPATHPLRDRFALLGVAPSASDAELRRAFLEQARLWHPDKCNAQDAAERFRQVHEAFETLMSLRRHRHKQCPAAPPSPAVPGAGVPRQPQPAKPQAQRREPSAASPAVGAAGAKASLFVPRARRRSSAAGTTSPAAPPRPAPVRPQEGEAKERGATASAAEEAKEAADPGPGNFFDELMRDGQQRGSVKDSPWDSLVEDALLGATCSDASEEADLPAAKSRRLPKRARGTAKAGGASGRRRCLSTSSSSSEEFLLHSHPGLTGARQDGTSERRPARAAAVRGRWKAASAGGVLGAALRQRLEEICNQLKQHRLALQRTPAGGTGSAAYQASSAAAEVLGELEALEANVSLDAHSLHAACLPGELALPWWRDGPAQALARRAQALLRCWEARCTGGGTRPSAAEGGA